jgi:hypothetical protein
VPSEYGRSYWNTPNKSLGSIEMATIYKSLEEAKAALPQLRNIHKMSYSKHSYGRIEVERVTS